MTNNGSSLTSPSFADAKHPVGEAPSGGETTRTEEKSGKEQRKNVKIIGMENKSNNFVFHDFSNMIVVLIILLCILWYLRLNKFISIDSMSKLFCFFFYFLGKNLGNSFFLFFQAKCKKIEGKQFKKKRASNWRCNSRFCNSRRLVVYSLGIEYW